VQAALSNGGDYHLAAWIFRGKSVIYGVNGEKSSPKYKRCFRDKGRPAYCCHAEMMAIDKAKANEKDVLYVARFKKDGSFAVSKPCAHCMKHIRRAGIRKIWYVDYNGNWVKEKIDYP
jgi:deoxycytidylate deaminase